MCGSGDIGGQITHLPFCPRPHRSSWISPSGNVPQMGLCSCHFLLKKCDWVRIASSVKSRLLSSSQFNPNWLFLFKSSIAFGLQSCWVTGSACPKPSWSPGFSSCSFLFLWAPPSSSYIYWNATSHSRVSNMSLPPANILDFDSAPADGSHPSFACTLVRTCLF